MMHTRVAVMVLIIGMIMMMGESPRVTVVLLLSGLLWVNNDVNDDNSNDDNVGNINYKAP